MLQKELSATFNKDATIDSQHEVWTLVIKDSSELPDDTKMYVSVEGKRKGSSVAQKAELVNTGYYVNTPLVDDSIVVEMDIPEVPGVASSETAKK